MGKTTGSFTLPGESGYEQLTLALAEKWGVDVIRDSDGTALSREIIDAGHGIYSTICIVRDHNEWARLNPDKLQQTFLMTAPLTAEGTTLRVELMADFFAEQFAVNDSAASLRYWQVFDRTAGAVLPRENWRYVGGAVELTGLTPWHRYTVSFLAFRVWEEISMYNHTTNGWTKEHLMQVDPIHPDTQDFLLDWLDEWCVAHPDTTVVRFTSLFYNFVWMWGADERNRHLFTDWGSYDFTVSPLALDRFAEQYGYALTAEDFVNGGRFHVTHMAPVATQRDWMDFIGTFVTDFGRRLVDVVHRHGKAAYVFYDDSWVGVEPYSDRFARFGFDGVIKCVFSGFEARLCAGVEGAKTHELRLHPYLFPVGLGGAPTFMEGGAPKRDAQQYWNSVRRALLRAPIDRIGLGGYLHLVEAYPDFCDYIETVADEFRAIKALHESGAPACLRPKIGVLTAWGRLRAWTCSGHYHENPENDLINLIESLSGMAFDVTFLDFADIKAGGLAGLDAVINAGFSGSAWSGGDAWRDTAMVDALTAWVHGGGVLLGVNAPSAVEGYDTLLRMSGVLGVDVDTGARVNHGRWRFDVDAADLLPAGAFVAAKVGVHLTDGRAAVLAAEGSTPTVTVNAFGRGKGIYLASFRHSPENTRLLQNLLLYACGDCTALFVPDNLHVECAHFPQSGKLVAINNSSAAQQACIPVEGGALRLALDPYDTRIVEL